MRGILTQEVADKARELLGEDITTTELRLMPYLQYCAVNGLCLDRRRINKRETGFLSKWEDQGRLATSPKMELSEEFWHTMCELIWLAYVRPEASPNYKTDEEKKED